MPPHPGTKMSRQLDAVQLRPSKRLSSLFGSLQEKLSRDRVEKDSTLSCQPETSQAVTPSSHQFFFEYLVVVSLQQKTKDSPYGPQIIYKFPKQIGISPSQRDEEEKALQVITLFCFPEGVDWIPLTHETFSFVLTETDGSRQNGYCRRLLPHGKGKRSPEAYCIISKVACFGLFSKIFDEVEKRREKSMAMIYPFMQSLREAPFPEPGKTVQIKSFIPESGTEHTFISTVPTVLMEVVMAPTPFMLGVQKNMLDNVIDQNELEDIGDEDSLLPETLQNELLEALCAKKDNSTPEELNTLVSEAFVSFFIQTVGHFSAHVKRKQSHQPGVFQRKTFCKSIEHKSYQQFVTNFISTQMFDVFIQEVERRPASNEGL
ncbi:hypothetical protein NHX12_029714 [Muraenolepis orangiensis]|uniref:UDENN domain-containing protein n=1 Tax=Muraenolepis orangiensis TaxID=630683 RepID=A0A9Q0EAE2_9TELE|nr:hypothetical protein NHX12_029714 [Muraenolepis orangiensis]